jgi:hypothetical protein
LRSSTLLGLTVSEDSRKSLLRLLLGRRMLTHAIAALAASVTHARSWASKPTQGLPYNIQHHHTSPPRTESYRGASRSPQSARHGQPASAQAYRGLGPPVRRACPGASSIVRTGSAGPLAGHQASWPPILLRLHRACPNQTRLLLVTPRFRSSGEQSAQPPAQGAVRQPIFAGPRGRRASLAPRARIWAWKRRAIDDSCAGRAVVIGVRRGRPTWL